MSDADGVNDKLITALSRLATVIVEATATNINLQAIYGTVLTWRSETNSKLESLRTEIADLQNVLGAAAGGPTTTVAGLLAIIAGNTSCVQRACGPGGDDADGCVEPLVSTAQATNSLYPGRNFATWVFEELPSGLSLGSFLDHDVVQAQLVHSAGSGWKAYVKSNGAASYSINPDFGYVFSTNQWTDVSPHTNMAFNVPDNADITVYLCNPTPASWLDCLTIASNAAYMTTPGGSHATIEYIPMSEIPLSTYANQHANSSNSGYFSADQPDYVVLDDWIGVKVTLVSGSSVRFFYQKADYSFVVHLYTTIGESYTITEHTIAAVVDNWTDNIYAPFSVEICPPELE